MSKLLRAGFHRYLKTRLFLICALLSVVIGAWFGLTLYWQPFFNETHMWIIILQMAVMSVFVTLTVGEEYTYGGFRRKIVPGYTRGRIFFAELISAMVSSTLLFVLCGLTVAVINMRLIPSFTIEILFLFTVGVWLGNMLLVTTVLTIAMLISSRTVASVLGLLFLFGMLLWADTVGVKLEQPEYRETLYYSSTSDTFVRQTEKNSSYIAPPLRNVLEPINACLPISQLSFYETALHPYFFSEEAMEQVWEGLGEHGFQRYEPITLEELQTMRKNPLYSALWIFAVVFVGFLLFRKKELK